MIRSAEFPSMTLAGPPFLVNRAQIAIASMAYVWSFRTADGRVVPHQFLPGTNPSVLLPFGRGERTWKFGAFWQTIFPGSKRLMTSDGQCYGDNTDIRAPAADELWHGGFISGYGGSSNEELEPVKLALDGVFFVDGGFAGPNRLGTWEHTRFAAEAHLACAALACEARARNSPPGAFFLQVQQLTGQTDEMQVPPPPPPRSLASGAPDAESIRRFEQRRVGQRVLAMRKSFGDEAAIARTAEWSDAPVPKLHEL